MKWLDQLRGYVRENTPRATTPRVSPGKVFNEGLVNPNKFNAVAADRFKETVLPMLGVPGAVADTADQLNKGNPGMAAWAATGMIPGVGALGSIVRKGDPNTLISHATSALGLNDALRGKWPYQKGARHLDMPNRDPFLQDPSLAVSNLRMPFGGEVQLYVNPSKVDPANTPRSSLFATDSYTYRTNQHRPYLSDSSVLRNPRFSENYDAGRPSKYAAILSQPKFASLQEYADSPYGAGRLSENMLGSEDYSLAGGRRINEQFNEYLMDNYDFQQAWDKADFEADAQQKANLLSIFLAERPDMAGVARRMPTEYGEIKYAGNLPLTPEYIAAARFPDAQFVNPDVQRMVVQRLRRQGIPIVPKDMKYQGDIAKFVDYRTGLRDKPAPVVPYNDPDWKI